METGRHANLKLLAAAFLRGQGCAAVGLEVRCPASRYRADVAGYLDRLPQKMTKSGGRSVAAAAAAPADQSPAVPPPPGPLRREDRPKTVLIECKQTRADFLRDTAKVDRLLAVRERLEQQRREMEEHRIKPAEPELRRSGTFLFSDLESWDFTATRLPTYRRIIASLRDIDAQLYGETKFWLMARYRLADYLFLMAPAGMIRRRELPRGWGLLECPTSWLRGAGRPARRGASAAEDPNPIPITVAAEPLEQPSKPDHQQRLLRNIAAAATRAWMAAHIQPTPPAQASQPSQPARPARRRAAAPEPAGDWLF